MSVPRCDAPGRPALCFPCLLQGWTPGEEESRFPRAVPLAWPRCPWPFWVAGHVFSLLVLCSLLQGPAGREEVPLAQAGDTFELRLLLRLKPKGRKLCKVLGLEATGGFNFFEFREVQNRTRR